jgi:hypothetical protein
LLVLCVAACGQEFVSAPPAGDAIPANDLLLWLRADQGVTETRGGVSRWADQSDRHSDAVQDQPGLRPTRNVWGIHFDGIDDYLAMPAGFSDFSRGLSIVAVVDQQPVDTCTAVVELSNGSEIDDISFGQYQNRILYEVFDQDTSGDTLSYGVPYTQSVVHRTDQTVSIHLNRATAGSASFALPTVIGRDQNFVGRTLYAGCSTFGGEIAELIVYGRALGDAELATIEQDLRRRWACCGN